MIPLAIIVRAKHDESTDSVIKRFKKRIISDNLLQLVKRKEFHMKPALLKKEARKELAKKLDRERRGLPPRRKPAVY